MLELDDIHTYYRESYVLQGVSLKVNDAQIIGLLGRNGMGKTTTIRSIMNLNPPRSGTVVFNRKPLKGLRSYQISRMGIGLVPQGRRIFPSLTVKENLTMALRGGETNNLWTLDNIYSLFPVLKGRAKHRGNELSGGEQQMLAIGRAMMTNPTLLLMDEPSEGLAPLIVKHLSIIIRELNKNGVSILLVEQNLSLALEVVNYLYIIQRGKVVYDCTTQIMKENPRIKSAYLGVDV